MPHHNYIKPHEGMSGKTHADSAGIDVRSNNKRRAPMQNAAAVV